MTIIKLTPAIHRSVKLYLEGQQILGNDINPRSGNRGGLLRLPLEAGGSIVVKVWRLRNIKERIKSVAHLSNGWREWRMHRMLYRAGIPTPQPFWFHCLNMANDSIYEAMAIEDLGATERGLDRLKKLIARKDEDAVISLEDRIILITEKFVNLRVLDVDHQLNNFLVDARDRIVRTDFECAHRKYLWALKKQEYPEMIARLLTSHIYAVQPDVARSILFAERLYKKLNLNHQLRSLVRKAVNNKLERQRRKKGIVSIVRLP